MTRFIRLSRGGQMALHVVESCPECGIEARYIQSEGTPFVDDDAHYRCMKCDHQWPMVH